MPRRRPLRDAAPAPTAAEPPRLAAPLRIIGGALRGRPVPYGGDPRTRPMKDRVREAVFNLLGEFPPDAIALDLFAGTGALALEALSRGAARAICCEQHFPTADLIRRSAADLGLADRLEVRAGDAFYWGPRLAPEGPAPWVAFCSPPYELYVTRGAEMVALLADLARRAPTGSVLVVEADERFDLDRLPAAAEWRRRSYPPAEVALWRKEGAAGEP